MTESDQAPSTPTVADADSNFNNGAALDPHPPLSDNRPTQTPKKRNQATQPHYQSPANADSYKSTSSISKPNAGSPAKSLTKGFLSAFGMRSLPGSIGNDQGRNDSSSLAGSVPDDGMSVRSLRTVRSIGNISLVPTFARGTGGQGPGIDSQGAGRSWVGEMLRMQDTTASWRIEDWQQSFSAQDGSVENQIVFPSDDEFEHKFEREFDEIDQDDSASESVIDEQWKSKLKHYIIFSSAGKVVWSRHGSDSQVFKYAPMIQGIALIQENPEEGSERGAVFRGFSADGGAIRISVLTRDNLSLIGISRLGETEVQLQSQLNHLYMQILSTLTSTTMARIFQNRPGADLRRPLQGTESILSALADGFTRGSASTLLTALECLKLRSTHRKKIDGTFLRLRAPKLLYGLLVAGGKLVSVIRPRQHSLHPGDLHLIFNLLFESGNVQPTEACTWIPICLPGFNSEGFLHMYTSFVNLDESAELSLDGQRSKMRPTNVPASTLSPDQGPRNHRPYTKQNTNSDSMAGNHQTPSHSRQSDAAAPPPSAQSTTFSTTSSAFGSESGERALAVILITTEMTYFDTLHRMSGRLIQELRANGGLGHIAAAVRAGRPSCTDLVPNTTIKHFLYKSKAHVQFMMPSMKSSSSLPAARSFSYGADGAASLGHDKVVKDGDASTHGSTGGSDFATLADRRRLLNVYSHLNGMIHTRPKLALPRLCHVTSREYLGLVWATSKFEFYAVAAPAPGSAQVGTGDGPVTGSGNASARDRLAKDAARMVDVIRREEQRVFLSGDAVF